MSSEIKFKEHHVPKDGMGLGSKSAVKLTDLLSRVKAERKKERNSNIALSVAAVSAVTVFGIILSL